MVIDSFTFSVWVIAIFLVIITACSKYMIGWLKALITDDFSDKSDAYCMAGMLGWAFLLLLVSLILESL